jgi:LacI family transcriptional regulator
LAYFNEVKINVPEQIKVIGFSNWFMSKVITPSLSTVDQPSYEMGVQSFKLLLNEILNKKNNIASKNETVVLETQIIERKSTSL